MDAPATPVVPVASSLVNASPAVSAVSKNTPPVTVRWLTPWIVSGLVNIILLLTILVIMPLEPWYWWKGVVAQYITGREYIVADAGVMGDDYFDIIVHKARLRKPGWIVVSAVYFPNDKNCNEVFGVSDYLPQGTVSNATIRIPNITMTNLDGTTDQPALPPKTQVIVTIAYDTDGSGEFKNPIFVTDKNGDRIFAKTVIGVTK